MDLCFQKGLFGLPRMMFTWSSWITWQIRCCHYVKVLHFTLFFLKWSLALLSCFFTSVEARRTTKVDRELLPAIPLVELCWGFCNILWIFEQALIVLYLHWTFKIYVMLHEEVQDIVVGWAWSIELKPATSKLLRIWPTFLFPSWSVFHAC